MNTRLYAAATLPADELTRDRGAFFGSLFGTLAHIVAADLIWQAGVDLGVTDLDALIPSEARAACGVMDAGAWHRVLGRDARAGRWLAIRSLVPSRSSRDARAVGRIATSPAR